jgi:GABA(A) receptor-associated protein
MVTIDNYITKFKLIEFDSRKHESSKLVNKFPDRIPVIIDKATKESPSIDRNKFLVPKDITIGQFMYIVRNRTKLNKDEAIFLYVNNTLPNSTELMSSIYSKYKDKDGFLYISYSIESTFG